MSSSQKHHTKTSICHTANHYISITIITKPNQITNILCLKGKESAKELNLFSGVGVTVSKLSRWQMEHCSASSAPFEQACKHLVDFDSLLWDLVEFIKKTIILHRINLSSVQVAMQPCRIWTSLV